MAEGAIEHSAISAAFRTIDLIGVARVGVGRRFGTHPEKRRPVA